MQLSLKELLIHFRYRFQEVGLGLISVPSEGPFGLDSQTRARGEVQ